MLFFGVSDTLEAFCLSRISMWEISGELYGAGREALRCEESFPLEMTYTVQKSGAPFETLLDILDDLNLHISDRTYIFS